MIGNWDARDPAAIFDEVQRAIATWPLFERIDQPFDPAIDTGLTIVSLASLRETRSRATAERDLQAMRQYETDLVNRLPAEHRALLDEIHKRLWRSPELERLHTACRKRPAWAGRDLPFDVPGWATLRAFGTTSDGPMVERWDRVMSIYARGRVPGRWLPDGTMEALGAVAAESVALPSNAASRVAEIEAALAMRPELVTGVRWKAAEVRRARRAIERRGDDASLLDIFARHALAGARWSLALPGREVSDDPEIEALETTLEWLAVDDALSECEGLPGETLAREGWFPVLRSPGGSDPVFLDLKSEAPVLVQYAHDSGDPISDPLPWVDAIRLAQPASDEEESPFGFEDLV